MVERGVGAAVLCLVGVLLPVVLLAQDVVITTEGSRLRGEIVSETRKGIRIKTLGGTIFVPRREIARVERDGDVFRTFEARQAKLDEHDADGWYRLGVWAQDQGLHPQAIDCFHQAVGIDPDHEDARWELSYRKLNGRWVTEADYYAAKGYVRWRDGWVTQAEYENLEAGLVEVDGRWVSEETARALEAGQASRPGPREPSSAPDEPARPEPPSSAGDGARPRRPDPNPWRGGGAAPLGGQVGGEPLTPEQREAGLARGKAEGSWQVAHASKYYDFFSNGPEEEVRGLARTLDLMCEEFKDVFKFERDITRPFPVHLYGSQQEFMRRTGHGQGTGGFYDGSKIVGFHGNLGSLTTQSVLFHEGTHQFQGLVMGRNMWKAKIWLIEGLAVFFEASKVRGKRLELPVIPAGRLANVRRAIQSGQYVPLRNLIRMEQAQFGALHYAHAWSLIHFLLYGAKGGKKRFVEYWERTKLGSDDPVALFEELFDKPMDEIEAAWKQYVLRLRS